MKAFFNRCRKWVAQTTKIVGSLLFGSLKTEPSLDSDDFRIQKYNGVYFFLSYDKHRGILLDLKRNRESKWLPLLSTRLYEGVSEIAERSQISTSDPVLLVPIPLSRRQLFRRGFNQSRILLKSIERHDKHSRFILETDNLIKIRHTPKQATQSRSKRLSNQKDAFVVRNTERLGNKTIFVFDDISTTGSTLKEARRELVRAGARHVICISLAH